MHLPSSYTTCGPRSVPGTRATIETVSIDYGGPPSPRYLDKTLYPLLDVERVRLEATGELPRHFVDEVVVRHVLAVLHDPDNTCLPNPILSMTRMSRGSDTSVYL